MIGKVTSTSTALRLASTLVEFLTPAANLTPTLEFFTFYAVGGLEKKLKDASQTIQYKHEYYYSGLTP